MTDRVEVFIAIRRGDERVEGGFGLGHMGEYIVPGQE